MSIHTHRSGQSKCKFQVSREHLENHTCYFSFCQMILSCQSWLRRWCHPLTPGHRKDLMHDDNERRRWILWITGCFVFFFWVLGTWWYANSITPKANQSNSPKRMLPWRLAAIKIEARMGVPERSWKGIGDMISFGGVSYLCQRNMAKKVPILWGFPSNFWNYRVVKCLFSARKYILRRSFFQVPGSKIYGIRGVNFT